MKRVLNEFGVLVEFTKPKVKEPVLPKPKKKTRVKKKVTTKGEDEL